MSKQPKDIDDNNDNDDDASGELDFIHDVLQIVSSRNKDDVFNDTNNGTNNDVNDVILEEDNDKGQEQKRYCTNCPDGTSSSTTPQRVIVVATDCSTTGSNTSILNDDTDGKDTSTTKEPGRLPILPRICDLVLLTVVDESQSQVSFNTNTNNTNATPPTTTATTTDKVRPGAQYVVPSGSVPETTTNCSNSHTVQQQQQQLNETSTTTTLLHAILINHTNEELRTAVSARTVSTTRGSIMQQQNQNIQHAEPLDDISINDDEKSLTTNNENVVGNNNNANINNRNGRRSRNRRGSDDKRSNKRTTVYCYLLVCLGICIATILIFFVVDPIQQKQEGSTTVGSSANRSSSNNINNTVNDTTTSSTSSSNMFTRHGLIVRQLRPCQNVQTEVI